MLKKIKPMVPINTYRTIKGQIKNGNEDAAIKGMQKIMEKYNDNRAEKKIMEKKRI